ncbi:hypothetical protein OEZ86_012651 [Tetradesmus obliquus]|nr:hypothetical protein OEZ86_012651 [Tetradesmus obliquus]
MVTAAHSTELQLEDGTLHLAVDLLDRFLSAVPAVACSAGQALGATCLWLASKYEEVVPCTMDDLRWLTGGAFSAQQLRDTEQAVLLLLLWRLALPTAWSFHSQMLADTGADNCELACESGWDGELPQPDAGRHGRRQPAAAGLPISLPAGALPVLR